ncbi:DUF305 domain-containing protein [Micromonospora sp. NPDC005413]|uniref:DUF305 domain-containing protein n=1 Tax=Micromonospora sp. NPDC005413 TaxID=3154563 RepID=UPI0033ABA340
MTRIYLRRAFVAGVSITTAFTLSACGSSSNHNTDAEHTVTSSPTHGTGQTNPGAGNAADVMFAQMMIPHHQQAVQMADLAATRAVDTDVRQLAAQIKAAQAPEVATMTRWLAGWGTPAPTAGMPGMDHGMPGMSGSPTPGMGHGMPGMMTEADMAKLTVAIGGDFDKQFLTMMIAHHQGAIAMAKDELTNGANTDAKNLAQQIIDDQQAEIVTVNKILARL